MFPCAAMRRSARNFPTGRAFYLARNHWPAACRIGECPQERQSSKESRPGPSSARCHKQLSPASQLNGRTDPMPEQTTLPAVAAHGARRLPSVDVDSYNVELKDSEGFIGDRASRGAFRDMIERIRKTLRKSGDDPLGEQDSEELSKAELDSFLQGQPEPAGIIHTAIEDFSQEF